MEPSLVFERVEPRLSEARNSGETDGMLRRTPDWCYKQTNKHNADDDLMGAVLITAM